MFWIFWRSRIVPRYIVGFGSGFTFTPPNCHCLSGSLGAASSFPTLVSVIWSDENVLLSVVMM